MKKTVFVATLLAAGIAHAGEGKHLELGKPIGGTPLTFQGYVAGYKSKFKAPQWVAYNLTPACVGQKSPANNQILHADQSLTDRALIQAEPADLATAGYLLLVSPENISGLGAAAEKDAYSVANAVVLEKGAEGLRKVWESLNVAIGDWAKQYNSVWVVAGGIYPADPAKTSVGRIAVPEGMFAVVARKEDESVKAIAFKFPMGSVGKLEKFICPVAEIEKSTGLDLLSSVPAEQRSVIKSQASAMWPVSGGQEALPDAFGNSTAADQAGQSAAKPVAGNAGDSSGGTKPSAPGLVWALVREGVYYQSTSKIAGQGVGSWMEEDAAKAMGFKGVK